MEGKSITNVEINRYTTNNYEKLNDTLAVEEPLEIRIRYSRNNLIVEKKVSITMRTPGNDKELAIGFLFTEGIISSILQINSVDQFEENKIVVTLSDNTIFNESSLDRNFYTTSSCGVCGKASIEAIQTTSSFHIKPIFSIDEKVILSLPEKLNSQQDIFKNTGGLHASAIFNLSGDFLSIREDVGRHNALDKLIGSFLINNEVPLDNTILILSGRASFELIQKAGMAAIPLVAAIGAPSSLAVELAKSLNIRLIGFLKKDRFNLY